MRSHMLRNNVLGAALACAFAAAPFSQTLAQDANGQLQKSVSTQTDNETVPDKAADAWITTKVKAELATTKNVSASDINVETSDSRVTLSGMVSTKSEKMHAVAKAKAVKGVKSVDASNLRVNAMHPNSSMDKTDHAMPAGDASAQAMAAGSNGDMHESAENHMDNQTVPDKAADAWITTKVKTELATTKHVKASDISVETNDGVVILSGMVPSKSGKMNAVKKAKAVKGVKSVDAGSLKVGTVDKASSMHNADHPMSDMPAHSAIAGH